ncbi:hypothetical protein [Streptomyces vilmorinianum]|uniref:hypothetical protein n=1 Tax=Streptomyces vilmorinianum TaxID=3051092 RepID=UPI0010FBACDE|nr:hypothetical protein [Streptomyces vilmorinianum]
MNGDGSGGGGLQASARGWLTLQLAVLGFVGLCGALKSGGGTSAPRTVEAVAGVLVLLALAVACAATYLVARTAWPLFGAPGTDGDAAAARRLRVGIGLTFVAVALTAAAATAAWWPEPEQESGRSAGLVEVATSSGTWCGALRPGTEGAVRLRASGQSVDVPLAGVLSVTPVAACR